MQKPAANSVLETLKALAPGSSAVVPVGDLELTVHPVTMLKFAALVRRFAALKALLGSFISDSTDDEDENGRRIGGKIVDTLIDVGPDALAAFVAESIHCPGPEGESLVKAMADEHLLTLVEAAMDQTMPRGVADFFTKFVPLAARVGLFQTGQTTSDI